MTENVEETDQERLEAYLELLLISNMRLYDVMLNVFSELAGADDAQALRAKHMANHFFYPPVVIEDDDAATRTGVAPT